MFATFFGLRTLENAPLSCHFDRFGLFRLAGWTESYRNQCNFCGSRGHGSSI